MTLAARCPSCNTVFRVVQDQLRVSEGWVRCGRCAEVFNAIDTLVEIDTDLPPKAPAPGPSTARVLSELARVRAAELPQRPAEPPPPPPGPAPRFYPPLPEPRSLTTFEPVAPERPESFEPFERFEPPAPPQPLPEPAPRPALASAVEPEPAPVDPPDLPDLRAEPDGPAAPAALPSFVKQAEKAARWRRPGVRAALAVAALAAALLLAAQALFTWRDIAYARYPVLQPVLLAGCGVLGCSIEPPRAIDALAVESSGLVRIDGTAMYRLNVMLKNRAPYGVAPPAIDLLLTDSQGGVIARRVVRVAELGMRQPAVAAGTNLPLQGAIGGLDRTVSGYTIEIFYP